MSLQRFLRLLCAALLALSVTTGTRAQEFPAHALRLTVPYPAGGAVDLLARQIAAPLRAALGQDVLVENLPGAAGALGLQKMLLAPPDGHELALGTDSDTVLVPLVNTEIKYKPTQFRLIGLVSTSPMVLVAGTGLTTPDLAKLLDEARRPGARPLSIGSYGVGSNSHFCAEDFAQRAGIALTHVPYKGIAPLLQDLYGGHVELAFLPLVGGVFDTLASGKLRPLGLATAQRDTRLPQLPTIAQSAGIPGFVHVSWGALVVSAAAPERAVERLHQALQDVLRNPAFQKELAANGTLVASPASLTQAQQVLQAEIEKTRPLAAQWLARGAAAPR